MAISANPTQTITFEKNWNRQINSRWRAFKKNVVNSLIDLNKSNTTIINRNDPFILDASQQRIYMQFFDAQIQSLLIVTDAAPNWQAEYQLQSYQRGYQSTRDALISQGASLAPTVAEQLAAQSLSAQTFLSAESIAVAFNSIPAHQEALSFLFNRSYTRLKNWTDRLSDETRDILFNAVREGRGIDEVVRDMVKRIDVSRSRARAIAQTEINQAYSRSSITEVQRASEELGIDINIRWLTKRDTSVRHTHAILHGVVMSPERASSVKTTDGVNCRCGLAPVIPGANTESKQAKFARERQQLLRDEAQNQR